MDGLVLYHEYYLNLTDWTKSPGGYSVNFIYLGLDNIFGPNILDFNISFFVGGGGGSEHLLWFKKKMNTFVGVEIFENIVLGSLINWTARMGLCFGVW